MGNKEQGSFEHTWALRPTTRRRRLTLRSVVVAAFAALVATVAFVIIAAPAQSLVCPADGIEWDGGPAGDWDVATNWVGDVIPGPTDDACVTANLPATVTINDLRTVGSLTSDGDITITSIGDLTVAGSSAISGNLSLAGDLRAPGGIVLSGTTTTPSGSPTLAGTVTNTGTVIQSRSVGLDAATTTVITNEGPWDITNNSGLNRTGTGTNPIFDNSSSGTLRKSGGTSFSSVGSTVDFSSSGSIDVDTGTLDINNALALAPNTFDVATGAALDLDGNSTTPATLGGTYSSTGTGTVFIRGSWETTAPTTFNFAPGVFSMDLDNTTGQGLLTATFPFTNDGGITITSTTWITGGTITNNGTLTLLGQVDLAGSFTNGSIGTVNQDGNFSLDPATTITNDGTWDILDNSNISSDTGTNSTFTNSASGTLRKSGGTSSSTFDTDVDFSSIGGIEVATGTLDINNVTALATTIFDVASGAMLDLNGDSAAPATLGGTYATTGTGSVRLQGSWETIAPTTLDFAPGVLTLDTDVAAGQGLIATAFPFTNAGDISVVSNSRISGGTITNDGTLTLIGGTITLSGALANNGTLTQAGVATSVNLNSDLATSVVNNGLWDIAASSTSIGEVGDGTNPTFTNSSTGTLRKSGGTSNSVSATVDFSSAGTIDVDAGTFNINNVVDLVGGTTTTLEVVSGAELRLTGDTTAPAPISGTYASLGTGTVTWRGSWATTGATTFNFGTGVASMGFDSGAAEGLVATAAPFTNDGDLTWTFGRITGGTITNNGTLNLGGSTMTLGGAVTNDGTVTQTSSVSSVNLNSDVATAVTNNGLWELAAGSDISETGSGTNPTFTNTTTGTLHKSTSTATSSIASTIGFSSAGLIDVDEGTLDVNNVVSLAALPAADTFEIATGAALDVDGNTASPADLSGTFTSLGTGTITWRGSWATTGATTFNFGTGVASMSIDSGAAEGLDATAAPFTNDGDLTWTFGRITGGTITNNGTLNLGGSTMTLGGAVTNDGTVTQTSSVSSVNLNSDVATAVTNNGLWELAAGSDISETGSGTNPTFTNTTTGTLHKSTSTATSSIASTIGFSSAGLIDVDEGTLDVNNVVSLAALPAADTFEIATGAALDVDGNTASPADLSGTFTSLGTGTITWRGSWATTGATTFNFGTGVASMSIDSGAAEGLDATAAPFTNDGDLTWTFGRITGGTITNNGTLNLTGGSSRTLGGTVTNNGTVTQTSSFSFSLDSDVATAVTNNGLWELAAGSDISETGSGTNPTFTNTTTGTLRKSTSTSTSSIASTIDFTSTGLVESLNGALDIQDADNVPQIAATVLTDGTWRALNGATLDVGPSASSITEIGAGATVELGGAGATFVPLADLATNTGSLTIADGATFATVGNLTSTGDLIMGPRTDAADPSNLTVNGDFTENSTNSLHVEIAGVSSSGEFGRVTVTGTANLLGVLDIDLVGGFTPDPADSYDIIFYTNRVGEFATKNLTPFFTAQFLADRLQLNEAQNSDPVLDPIGPQSGDELTPITFAATATDSDLPAQTLTFSLEGTVPAGASIDPVTGVFAWNPTEAQGPDVVTVTVRVTDDGTPNLWDEEAFEITVNEVNLAPSIDPIANQTIDEQTLLSLTASATDPDLPPNTLTFSLVNPPAGASINSVTGAFSYTPPEDQGPGVRTITVRVTDNGSPNLPAETSFDVTINEVNRAPFANAGPNDTVIVGNLVTLDGSGSSDPDIPAQTLTYAWQINSAPAGSTATLSGATTVAPTFTPDEPGLYIIQLVVNDGIVDSLANTVFITAELGQQPPELDFIAVQGGDELTLITFTATASDPNGDGFSFTLEGTVPAGANIDPVTGVFTWTPTEEQGPATEFITVRVTDDSPGALFDEQTVQVNVAEVNQAPTVDLVADETVNELALLTVPVTASDPDLPPQTLTFSLTSAPAGAVISPTTGLFSWTPTEAQGPGVYPITVRVTDDGPGELFDETTFNVEVFELGTPPVLDPIADDTVDEGSLLTVQATASDADEPAETLTFSLVGPPLGAVIDPVTGLFSWTPSEDQGPGEYTITVQVADDAVPPLSDTEFFTVTVNEVNEEPVLDPIGNQTIDELVELSFAATATDVDVPANVLTFTLDDGAAGAVPAGAVIDPTTGVFTWIPTEDQGPGVYTFDVVVTDNGTPTLSDSETITVEVFEVNEAPVADAGADDTVTVGQLVTLDGTGSSDPDIPVQTLTYQWQITTAPAGSTAVLGGDTTVAPTLTPDVAGDYVIELVVNDGTVNSAPDTVTITATTAANTPPLLGPIGNQSVDELVELSFTASATDGEAPPQTLTFTLDDGAAGAVPAGAVIDPTTGVFTWIPTEDQGPGVYTFDVVVTDNGTPTLSDSETITVEVFEVNEAPVADAGADDTVTVGQLVTLDGTGSSDPDIPVQTLTYQWQITTAPAGSTAVLGGDTTVAPTLTPDVAGDYVIELVVNDGTVNSAPDTVTITVTTIDFPPDAVDDTFDVPEGTGDRVFDVLANDSDPELASLTIVSNTDPAPGTGAVSCTADECTYTAPSGFTGTASFDYTISDGTNQDSATVTVNVLGCIDPTSAFTESGLVTGHEWLECAAPAAHETAGADLTPVFPPTGTLLHMTNGIATDGVPGDTANDDLGTEFRGAFDASVLRLDLLIPDDGSNCLAFDVVFASEEYPDFVNKPYNDGFLAELDASTWTVNGATIDAPDNFATDNGEYISVKGSFFDPGRVITDTGMVYNGSTPILQVFTPITAGAHQLYLSVFDGADAFENSAALIDNLTAFASTGCSPGASQPPVANDDDYTIDEDTNTEFDVLANDVDPDGDAITILEIVTPPLHGSVVVNATRTSLTYFPDANYFGPDNFEYTITDQPNTSGEQPVADVSRATVTIDIVEINDNPVALPDGINVPVNTVTVVDVLDNDFDVDGDPITVDSSTDPVFGSVTCSATDCTFTPKPDYDGPDSFTYTIIDGRGGSDTTTVYINSVPPPPGNQRPIADAGGPYEAEACPAEPCTPQPLDGTASFDPDGTVVSWEWFADTSAPVTIVNPTSPTAGFVTPDNGVFRVFLVVTDNEDAWDWDSAVITAFEADVTTPINEGSSATVTVDFFNPGGDLTTTIDWDDGSLLEVNDFSIFPFGKTHPYPQDGTYDVEVCVTGDTLEGPIDVCDIQTLTVDNVLPQVDAGIDRSLVVGGTLIQSRMSFFDPGDDAPWTATVDWGDGPPVESLDVDQATGIITMPTGHVYPNEGLYTVTVCVQDDDAEGCDSFDVDVSTNETPVADAGGPYVGGIGVSIGLDGSGSFDPDGTIESWNWIASDPNVTLTGADTPTPTFVAASEGTYEVSLQVCDDEGACSDLAFATVEVSVTANTPPVLDPVGDQTVDELVELSFTASATDGEAPPQTLTFTLDDGTAGAVPAGASIDPVTGVFSWIPTEDQGPGVYTFDVVVTDDGTPTLSDSETITVEVFEVNEPPVLGPVGDQTVDELSELSFTATATDVDVPANVLTFTLDDGTAGTVPAGASIDPVTGVFSWIPTEDQGPGVYTFDVVVTDDGTPTLSDSETITVEVFEVNEAPVLGPVGDQTVDELSELSFTATATDVDVPANVLTFTLDDGTAGTVPAGASIDPVTGVFSWIPTEDQGPGVYTFDVVVTDNGTPTLSDSETITVEVFEVNEAPVADAGADDTVTVGQLVTLDGTGSFDPDIPAQTLTYQWQITSAPAGSTAVLGGDTTVAPTLTPDVAGDYVIELVVNDGTTNSVPDTITITATTAANTPPVLDPVGDQTVDELVELSFTASATDGEAPPQTLTFTLEGTVPTGASIDPVTGVFSWIPTEDQGPDVYAVTVRVTDDGAPTLSDSETITVEVFEVNEAPVLGPVGDQTVDELSELSFTATATDVDVPANVLTFTLDDGTAGAVPAGASIDPVTGVFSWIPTEDQGPGVYTFDVVVTDDGTPTLSDSETITVEVFEVNEAPVLDLVGDQTVDELSELSFTATATDVDVPANVLTFTLDDGTAGAVPAGASIDPVTGVFSWIPTEDQGPGVYTFDVVVTDDGTPTLSDSETITVEVFEVNEAPVADAGADDTVTVGQLVTLDGTGSFDPDIPAQTLTYQWQITSAPAGSTAVLGGDTTVAPTLTPDVAGDYVIELVVNDGTTNSVPDTITITATEVPELCDITGTSGDDTLIGTAADETICGLGGNDVIDGGGGNDIILGGAGDDVLIGGPGNDSLNGDGGPEEGPGTDTANYTTAPVGVSVDLEAGTGVGDGTDSLANIENVDGSAFGDLIEGDAGPNVLNGNAGNDVINGRGGNDTMFGGAHTATNSGPQNEPGDRVSYFGAPTGVTVNLGSQSATGWGSDTIVDFENVFGSAFGDTILGDNNANRLFGENGNDVINGRGGNDTMFGGAHTATNSGPQNEPGDRVSYFGAPTGVTVNLGSQSATGWGSDTIVDFENVFGSARNDTILGDNNANRLFGENGNDRIDGGGGNDTMFGGSGKDRIDGNAGNDLILGGSGSDTLNGGSGVDVLRGGANKDKISGGTGNDEMYGEGGNDTLNDGSGADLFHGGAGKDTCRAAGGNDTFIACERRK